MRKEKEKNGKSKKLETVGAVTHTHTHTHKDVLNDTIGKKYKAPIENNNKIKNRRTQIVVPLIVVLLLICVIAVICVIAPFGRPSETAELNKDIDTNEEEILAATGDVAATTVGTNVKATYTASTKEVQIYSTSGIGTLKSDGTTGSINRFWLKVYDKVETVNFTNEVYAAVDSSDLFRGKNGSTWESLSKLTNIKNIQNLKTNYMTNATGMFMYCSSLTTLDVSGFDMSKVTSIDNMFQGCESLSEIDVSNWNTTSISDASGAFTRCRSLVKLDLSNWDFSSMTTLHSAFEDCTALSQLIAGGQGMQDCDFSNAFAGCSSLVELDLSAWSGSFKYKLWDHFSRMFKAEAFNFWGFS